MPIEKIPFHKHTGQDSPKIDVDGVYTGADALHTSKDETVAGVKTLTAIPILPAVDATADNQMIRKSQGDDIADTAPLSEILADDGVIDEANDEQTTQSSSYVKVKEIEYNEEDGTIRVWFKIQAVDGNESANALIYVNGVSKAVGGGTITQAPDFDTFEHDITVEKGDLVQLYIQSEDDGLGDTAKCKDFKLGYIDELEITPGTININ